MLPKDKYGFLFFCHLSVLSETHLVFFPSTSIKISWFYLKSEAIFPMDIVGQVAVLLRKTLFYNPHSLIFSARFLVPTLPYLPFNILQRGGEHEVPSFTKELQASTILQWTATSLRGNKKHEFDSEIKRVTRKQSWMAKGGDMDL